jgi:hypothetical protein
MTRMHAAVSAVVLGGWAVACAGVLRGVLRGILRGFSHDYRRCDAKR